MDPDEEAQIQQMLMSLLTHRQPEPVQEQTELDAERAARGIHPPGPQIDTLLQLQRQRDETAKHDEEYGEYVDEMIERKPGGALDVRFGQGGPPPMPTEWVPDPEIYPPTAWMQDAPVQETSPLQAARAGKAAEMMDSDFWAGAPMYYTPASAYDFTDEHVHQGYLDRLANDAERKSMGPRDLFYEDAWQEGIDEDDRHPDRAFPPGTPPYYRLPQRATR